MLNYHNEMKRNVRSEARPFNIRRWAAMMDGGFINPITGRAPRLRLNTRYEPARSLRTSYDSNIITILSY